MEDLRNVVVSDKVHMFFLLDCSGSMYGRPIQTLNEAMANLIPELSKVAKQKEVDVLLHVLTFDNDVKWICGTSDTVGVKVDELVWNDVSANGGTNTAAALDSLIKDALSQRYLGQKTFRPVIVLITDGESNDKSETMRAVDRVVARQKTIRIGIGVEGYNAQELEYFATKGDIVKEDSLGNMESKQENVPYVFPVAKAEEMASIIRAASVSSLLASILNGPEGTHCDHENADNNHDDTDTITIPSDSDDDGDFI